MEPLRIKLTFPDMQHLRDYLRQAEFKAFNPQAREELIVLAEHCPTIERRLVAAWRREKSKAYSYTLPLSVARILHRRWQQEPIRPELQIILGGIDYELTARGMKPDLSKPMIV